MPAGVPPLFQASVATAEDLQRVWTMCQVKGPPPKVDSAVVRLVPLPPERIAVQDRRVFAEVVRAAFGQRRKTLRNALSTVCDADLITAAGLDPQVRAEQVEVAAFVHLANTVAATRPG